MQVKKSSPHPLPGPGAGRKSRALLGQLSDMDLRLLKVFKSVVECGGMAAAELELNIGTSTVSRHVKDLETRLGLVLCRRGRAGFALTPEGQRVYQHTLSLLSAVDGFRSSIDDIHSRMGGQLEIAVFDKTASNPQARIAQAIERFVQQAPAVTLSLHVASLNTIERGLIDGQFHVGVVPTHRHSQSLSYADLFGETMHLYCGRQHPLFGAEHASLSWESLRTYPFAGLGHHSPNMEFSHRANLTRSATGSDEEAIALLILSSQFLGFLPDHYAQRFAQHGLMQAIAPQRFHYLCRFVSVLRRSPQPSRAAQLFHECLLLAHEASATPAQDSTARAPGGTSA
jgi:DNA-binding transcriptional LysR family regulator